jgi:hypothetical protein
MRVISARSPWNKAKMREGSRAETWLDGFKSSLAHHLKSPRIKNSGGLSDLLVQVKGFALGAQLGTPTASEELKLGSLCGQNFVEDCARFDGQTGRIIGDCKERVDAPADSPETVN